MNNILSDKYITFEKCSKAYWLRKINSCVSKYKYSKDKNFILNFESSIKTSELLPFHLVTLANLIQYLFDIGNKVFISKDSNKKVFDYIYNQLYFSEYWSNGKNHVDVKGGDNIFNLWRIIDSEKDLYVPRVENYFKRKYFHNRDLSVISQIMTEAYYNVFDHAQAQNNAFSLIMYKEDTCILHAAISDFGIGIANSVKQFDRTIKSDRDALAKAIEDNFTVRSTERNRGFGLSNILNGSTSARIFSGEALVVKQNESTKIVRTNFSFPGTLIYFEVDLSKTEEEEVINDFEW